MSAPCTAACDRLRCGGRSAGGKIRRVAGPQSRRRSSPTGARLTRESPGCRSRGFLTSRATPRRARRSVAAKRHRVLDYRCAARHEPGFGLAREQLRARPSSTRGALRAPPEVVAEQAAEPAVDRREQAAGDEDPRLGDRVAVGVDDAAAPGRRGSRRRRSRAPHGSACAPPPRSPCRRRPRSAPGSTGRRAGSAPLRHVGVGDRAEAACPDRRRSPPPHDSRKLPPRLVEAREVEVALRAEVPVEDRLA